MSRMCVVVQRNVASPKGTSESAQLVLQPCPECDGPQQGVFRKSWREGGTAAAGVQAPDTRGLQLATAAICRALCDIV